MNERPILSICIPTYNQPESIDAFFKSVSTQLTNKVEILICDDSTNDNTELVVQGHVSKISVPIRYFKGEKAKVGGYDKALLFLTGKANGEFLWWYGDDMMSPDAIQRILALISTKPNLSFIWLNSRDIDDPSDQGLNLGGDKYFRDGSEVFATNVGFLGFPSATLLRREEALTGFDAAQKYIGTTLTGFYLVLHVLSQRNREFMFLQNPCLLSNPKPPGEARWYDSFQVHGINYFIIAQEFRDKFDCKSLRKGLADQYGRIWRAVIVERALGFKTGFASPSPKIMKMAKLYWNYPEFYIALPLMLLPRSILRVFYAIYKGIKARMPIESRESLIAESTKAVAVVCPHDGAVILGVSTTLYRCPLCRRDYSVESGVLRMLGSNEEFYESVYGNPVKFLPKSERPWHIWPLWLINSGFLWMVRRHVPEHSVVLELGCAGGVRYFGKRYHMIGYDISFSSLLKTGGEYAQLLQADASTCICLPDKSVDAVISSFFWEHIQPDVKPRILSECSRVLRPGGKAIFLYDVETENPLIRHYRQTNSALYSRLFIECDRHVGYQRPADNLALFRAAGFSALEHRGMEKTWFQSPSTYGKLIKFGSAARWLFAWTNVLERPPLFYLYTAWMRLIDTVICPLLPRDYARIDLVVLEKESL